MLLSFVLLLFPADVFSGQVTLTWNAPTTNIDGTPITYFSGNYRIYYGTTSGNYSQLANLTNSSSIVTQQISNLTDGRPYYFVVTAVNTLGNESGYSNEISKTAQSGTPGTYNISFFVTGGAMTCTPTTVPLGGSFECTLSAGSDYYLESLLDNSADVTAQVSGNRYTVTNVSSDHNIQATFQQDPPVLRLWGSSGESWYTAIQSAYNASSGGDAILTLDSDYYEDLNFSRDVSISLFGGCAPDFNSVTGWTVINGKLTISGGAVIIDKLIIM